MLISQLTKSQQSTSFVQQRVRKFSGLLTSRLVPNTSRLILSPNCFLIRFRISFLDSIAFQIVLFLCLYSQFPSQIRPLFCKPIKGHCILCFYTTLIYKNSVSSLNCFWIRVVIFLCSWIQVFCSWIRVCSLCERSFQDSLALERDLVGIVNFSVWVSRRRRAKEHTEMAKRALEEGGSSYLNLTY